MTASHWQPLGTVTPLELADAKLQTHWAAQIVASFGQAILEPRSDDSQSNLGWEEGVQALCGHPSMDGYVVGLRLSDLTVMFFDASKNCLSRLSLQGKTIEEGLAWLDVVYHQETGRKASPSFSLRDYVMPDHPVANHAPFALNRPAAFQELQHWYANAHSMIHSMTNSWRQATPVRCWPHYFDLASLLTFGQKQDKQPIKTVGCGMSPGDGTYSEPYWYVTAWPYPSEDQLPELSVGCWHTEGFVGAILTATTLLESCSVETQHSCVARFFSEGTQASFSALGVAPSTS